MDKNEIHININADVAASAAEIAKAMSEFERPILLATQRFKDMHVHRSFKCARCKKSYPVSQKAIAPRAKGAGVVAWCLGCICSQVSSWEHPWATEMRPVFQLPTAMRLPTLYETRRLI